MANRIVHITNRLVIRSPLVFDPFTTMFDEQKDVDAARFTNSGIF
jgi:hypothetical protein